VYGVPETFVINREGRIAYKHIGAVTPQVLEETLLPLIERLRK
jgi:cytochrome c biogenesis protein CcmG/thiol:disulfide interchange protein DsbE